MSLPGEISHIDARGEERPHGPFPAPRSPAAKADAAFHEALFAHCGNRFLVQSYALISGQIGAMRYLARHSDRSREATPFEHRAIIEAIARGDLTAAVSILKAHIAAMPARFRKASQARA